MFKMFKGIFTCCLIVLIFLTACGRKEKTEDYIASNNISTKETSIKSNHMSVTAKKFTLYTIEDEQVVPKSIGGDNMDVEAVIESVMLEMDDLIDDVTVDVEKKGDSITVDFTVEDKKHPFGKKNQVSEVMVLECISYSVLGNFEEYKKIYFKLNGEAYVSEQLKLSEGKPFMADE